MDGDGAWMFSLAGIELIQKCLWSCPAVAVVQHEWHTGCVISTWDNKYVHLQNHLAPSGLTFRPLVRPWQQVCGKAVQKRGHTQVNLSGLSDWPGGCILIAHMRDIQESACSRQLDRWRFSKTYESHTRNAPWQTQTMVSHIRKTLPMSADACFTHLQTLCQCLQTMVSHIWKNFVKAFRKWFHIIIWKPIFNVFRSTMISHISKTFVNVCRRWFTHLETPFQCLQTMVSHIWNPSSMPGGGGGEGQRCDKELEPVQFNGYITWDKKDVMWHMYQSVLINIRVAELYFLGWLRFARQSGRLMTSWLGFPCSIALLATSIVWVSCQPNNCYPTMAKYRSSVYYAGTTLGYCWATVPRLCDCLAKIS